MPRFPEDPDQQMDRLDRRAAKEKRQLDKRKRRGNRPQPTGLDPYAAFILLVSMALIGAAFFTYVL